MQTRLSRLQKRAACIASLVCSLSLPGLLSAGQLIGSTVPKLSGWELANELQKGGYILYFRHGTTDNSGEKDVADTDLENCALQRNLSNEGRTQTKAIGQAVKKLRIPISVVYASPYCRCLETARNIFGQGQKSSALHFAIHLGHEQRAQVTSQLLDLLAAPPALGTNVALISHTANLQEAVGIWPKPEGVAHIFKPEGKEQFSYVGMMLPEEWAAVLSAHPAVAQPGKQPGWFAAIRQWFAEAF